MADVMPAIFFGHGNPMNAVTHNCYTDWFVPESSREKSNIFGRMSDYHI
jgi:aromatic ring-opening dioxygenase catalytic subunit (LigB family)